MVLDSSWQSPSSSRLSLPPPLALGERAGNPTVHWGHTNAAPCDSHSADTESHDYTFASSWHIQHKKMPAFASSFWVALPPHQTRPARRVYCYLTASCSALSEACLRLAGGAWKQR